jgi:hypothetical protein
MKTLKRIDVSFRKVQYMPSLSEMEESVIYISDEYGVSGHKCMCGCGSKTIMPIGKGEWNYDIHSNGKISMSPSVGNYQLPCKSHYIIQNGGANFV